jgi:hypothetical protein
MAQEIKQKLGAATALTHSFETLANQEGFISPFVDNADANNLGYKMVRIEYRIRSGASAPTDKAQVQFFLVTADDDGTRHIDGNLNYSTSVVTEYTTGSSPHTAAQIRDLLQPVHAQPFRTPTATDYYGSFVIMVPGGRNWAIYAFNDLGNALDTTAGNHYLRYVVISDDVR